MNLERSIELREMMKDLQELLDELVSIYFDEKKEYQNLPESLQNNEKGMAMKEILNKLWNNIYSNLNKATYELAKLMIDIEK